MLHLGQPPLEAELDRPVASDLSPEAKDTFFAVEKILDVRD
jgi:hypothetical protein